MERHKSALKAARQAIKHQSRNLAERSKCKTAIAKFRAAAVKAAKNKEEGKKVLPALLNETQRILMKSVSKNVYKPNTVSRQISRLSQLAHKSLS